MSLARIPHEILCRIFTVGCQEPLPPKGDDFMWSPSTPTQNDKRRLKDFSLLLSRVCREWFEIVHSKSNGHLWITRVVLQGMMVNDLAIELSEYSRALQDAEGSDLDVAWYFDDHWSLAEPLSSANDTSVRLLMHGMMMIVPYYRQIRHLKVISRSPSILHLLYCIINHAGKPGVGPSWLDINGNVDLSIVDEWHTAFPLIIGQTPAGQLSALETAELYGLMTVTLPLRSSLSTLTYLKVNGISYTNSILVPPSLHWLSIQGQSCLGEPLTRQGLEKISFNASHLNVLDLDAVFVGDDLVDSPSQKLKFPEVRKLSLRVGVSKQFMCLMRSLTFPRLESLTCAILNFYQEVATDTIILPTLRELFLTLCSAQIIEQLGDCMILQALTHLSISTWTPIPQPSDAHVFSREFYPNWNPITSLNLEFLPSCSALSLLSRLDLRSLTHFKTSACDEYGNGWGVSAPPIHRCDTMCCSQTVSLNRLSRLEINVNFNMKIPPCLFDRLNIISVDELVVRRTGWGGVLEIELEMWTNFCEYHKQTFSTVKILHICIPPFVHAAKHLFLHFPNLEEINLVSPAQSVRDPTSRLRWLSEPINNSLGARTPLLSPHLRKLHIVNIDNGWHRPNKRSFQDYDDWWKYIRNKLPILRAEAGLSPLEVTETWGDDYP